jgi:hypothetical protein
LSVTHPEADLLEHALDGMCAVGAGGDHLIQEPLQPIRGIEYAVRESLERGVVLVPHYRSIEEGRPHASVAIFERWMT